MANALAVQPSSGQRTWTVLDCSHRTVGSVEEWVEAHRHLWSPNTVRGYCTALAQWWTFLEQRGETDRWATHSPTYKADLNRFATLLVRPTILRDGHLVPAGDVGYLVRHR